MRTITEIKSLLEELRDRPANEIEDQDLDFKEWKYKSIQTAIEAVIDMAICMANGGGGTFVFGVNDKSVGRERAITGVPLDIDSNRLKKAVYDTTDPKLTPVFEDLYVSEGRLLVMQVYPGLPPYTDTSGKGKIRVGTDCQPLTGTLRRRVMVETGETDYTAEEIPEKAEGLISPTAMEQLRGTAGRERASDDLLRLSDLDLLNAIGVLRKNHLTRAGLLLAGKEEAIREFVPGYVWTHLRMQGDTEYSDRMDGSDALPIALARITDRIMADNPITTVQHGLFHFEYRTFPEIALREVLLNAFCHVNYRLPGPVLIRQYKDRLEISNPGGFIAGISPDNILPHHPAARTPHLVEALTRLRLVNRSNLGVPRMFRAMLIEGKEPPRIEEQGDAVKVLLIGGNLSAPFRAFVAEENQRGIDLSVDYLLILQYLLAHPEIDTATAARICQRRENDARDILSQMEVERDYLERGGTGRGTYWRLRSAIFERIVNRSAERSRRIDWETAKARVLSVLKQRSANKEAGLTNAEIRQITLLDRGQVKRLMAELRDESLVTMIGEGRNTRWEFHPKADNIGASNGK
jgi:ATP-dependent DNA helicase RecG